MIDQVWGLFQQWYGGGPSVSVSGPPINDTRRWIVHTMPIPSSYTEGALLGNGSGGGSSSTKVDMQDLVSRLEDPSRVERKKGGAAVTINTKGRR
jgi:hypothetical protein